jgi:hypothetical protein
MPLAAEAAELLEIFQWHIDKQSRERYPSAKKR